MFIKVLRHPGCDCIHSTLVPKVQSKYAKFEALQTERDAYDGEHQDKSCNEVLEGNVNASEDEPDDVS